MPVDVHDGVAVVLRVSFRPPLEKPTIGGV